MERVAGKERTDHLSRVSGAGAAGGIAFGLMAGLGARLVPGYDLVSDWLKLEQRIAVADLAVTGEGRFDASSLQGKGAGALARVVRALGKHVHVFAGRVEAPAPAAPGLTLHEISPHDMALSKALARAEELLCARVAGAF